MQDDKPAEGVNRPAATWPPRMKSPQAADYLTEVHGLQSEDKTLRNWRALGKGPVCKYFGTIPLYDKAELDRFAVEDALQAESPMRRNRRVAQQAAQQVAARCATSPPGPRNPIPGET